MSGYQVEMMKLRLLLQGAVIALGGCSGSGESMVSPIENPTIAPTDLFAEYRALGQALTNEIGESSLSNASSLPTMGRATYMGVMEFQTSIDQATVGVSGAMTLAVEFDSDSLSGTVSEIADSTGRNLSGELIIHNGSIDRAIDPISSFSLGGELLGQIEVQNGSQLSINGRIFGDFYQNGSAILGVVTGNSLQNNTPANITSGAFVVRN